jgi:hypothetical protein
MRHARSKAGTTCGAAYPLAVILLAAAAFVSAEPPVVVSAIIPNCVPQSSNALVAVSVKPDTGWSSVRVYFRKATEEPFYFLEARLVEPGKYWAVLPIPEKDNLKVDIRVALRDEEGREYTGDQQSVPVTANCQVLLTPDQLGYARNLVVGETKVDQRDREVLGFICEGIISRITSEGYLRPDDVCRRALLIAAEPSKKRLLLLLPLLITGGGGEIIRGGEPGEVSPSTP